MNRIQEGDDVLESAMKPQKVSRAGGAILGLRLDQVGLQFV